MFCVVGLTSHDFPIKADELRRNRSRLITRKSIDTRLRAKLRSQRRIPMRFDNQSSQMAGIVLLVQSPVDAILDDFWNAADP